MFKFITFAILAFIKLSSPIFSTSAIEPTPGTKPFQFYAYSEELDESIYNDKCMPCTSSAHDAGTIAFTEHWKIVYVPNQSYLGRSVISSRRHFGTYEDMTNEEALEYRIILKHFLPALQKTFNVTHFNVAYLMNMAFDARKPEPAFKNGKPNPHFHWHVIPRYDGTREFGGETFEDPDFGNSFNFQRKKFLAGNFRKQAIQAIRRHLDIIYLPNPPLKDSD